MYNMYHRITRGVKGFTLIELLAVMAIVAVLAGIIAVAVSGSGETSKDTQTVQDGTSIETSASEFFGIATGADLVETLLLTANQVHPYTNSVTAGQVTSSLWPEDFISNVYTTEFPLISTTISNVTVIEEDGTTTTVKELLEGFTAISFTELEAANVLTFAPDSEVAISTIDLGNNVSVDFHNFLWLFEKDLAAGSTGEVNSRNVAIYKLVTIEVVSNAADLIWLRIF